jgi:Domain of unknown function (DUF305)
MEGNMRFLQYGVYLSFIAGIGGVVAYAESQTALLSEAAFVAENQVAMHKMMAGMHAKPSGDVDRDFAVMMIPHHQGAIDMARAELRYGRNEQLHRIAQEIIVDQQQEIVAMRLALGGIPSPSGAASDHAPGASAVGPPLPCTTDINVPREP